MNKSINKTELIHIRIEPDVKVQSENIFKRLGVNTSYAVSMFLNQVILRGGFPFEIELPKNNNEEYTLSKLAKYNNCTSSAVKFSITSVASKLANLKDDRKYILVQIYEQCIAKQNN